ncbi:MAG: FtsW/RodA/SpoVE family cell cycle protein, partial [Candidatus Omnitrophota bacterium]|nr:FtsW/RodA/SpoVE family cell cycle protein [Candidatus Omnitrophota bacterium]
MHRSTLFILIIALLIATLGVLSVYSATFQKEGELWKEIYKRQMLWILFGVAAYLAVSNISYRRLLDWNYFLYAVMLLFLLLVFVLGIVRLGAQRWLKLLWFNFQPSELAKLIIVAFLAKYFSKKSVYELGQASGRFGIFRGIIFPFLFVIIPAGLIIEQPDLGSGAMIVILFFALLYLTEVRLKFILLFLLAGLMALPLFWHLLRDYQKQRL